MRSWLAREAPPWLYDEFKAGLAMIGFEPSEKALGEVLAIVDKDNDGEVDYEEFASRISKILGDEDFKQDSADELRRFVNGES